MKPAVLIAAAALGGCTPAAPLADAATMAAGERAFQRCFACHALSVYEKGADGPHLQGLVGRRVASVPGQAYSPAMRAYGEGDKRWTRERLDAFLADPQAEIPGNQMGFFGLDNPEERRALIEWLAARG